MRISFSRLAELADTTRKSVRESLHRMRNGGLITMTIERYRIPEIEITQKGKDLLASASQTLNRENRHTSRLQNRDLQVLYFLVPNP